MAKNSIKRKVRATRKAAPSQLAVAQPTMTYDDVGPVVSTYIREVTSGKRITGRYERLAVMRHLRDLKDGAARGIYFDEAAARHACDFFPGFLRHSKGKWAGQPFHLSPWEAFCTWVIFGWKRADTGKRRFRIAYNELARKNGKSTWAAGIGLYLAFADGEPGAEVYTAATKRDQAKITHSEAVRMVKKSPDLLAEIRVMKDNLSDETSASKFEPLGADDDTMDGLNIHGAIVDEVHAHKTRGVFDVIDTGTGAREQPLIFEITTAGFDRHSICWEHHTYGVNVLEGVIEDDTLFVFIAAIDPGDNWEDERVWAKANPNLNVSVRLDDLRAKATKAKIVPAAQNAFRQKHLDEWTEQAERAIDLTVWRENVAPFDVSTLHGRRCYVAIDLSSAVDLSCALKLFPPENPGERYVVLPRFWLPEDNLAARVKRDRVPYDVWVEKGLIETTPGNVIDYDFIRQAMSDDADLYEIINVSYDPWHGTQLAVQLQSDGMILLEHRQGFASMAGPTKEVVEKLIPGRQLNHLDNPVLAWNAANLVVRRDPAGNLKPDKEKSQERIDGMVALIMAVGAATREAKTEDFTGRIRVIELHA